jgi:hypothetical protein
VAIGVSDASAVGNEFQGTAIFLWLRSCGSEHRKNEEKVALARGASNRVRSIAAGLGCGRVGQKGTITEALLIITGSMGAGKTSVLGEASDILSMRKITHAGVDLDALGLAHLPSTAASDGVMYRNLESLCRNYESAGVRRLLLARAMGDRAELELCRGIVSASNTIVCRLTASVEVMEQRVKGRESGLLRQEYVARVAKLKAVLDAARLENFSVSNENRPLTEVAQEMLVKAGWISN